MINKLLIILFFVFLCQAVCPEDTGFQNFITRNEDRLMEGNKEFRFMSYCIPELSMQENPYWGINDPFAQEDAIKTIAISGGRVTRCYVFSIQTEDKKTAHVMEPGVYNEDCFKSFDNILMLCNKYKVRLIVPFIDTWSWWGGIKEFSQMRGKDKSAFYSNFQLKSDYKNMVAYVLNRRNTLTGIIYKDDPAILAWETGNELRDASARWTIEMAAYIKSIDKNHLVMDGKDDYHFPECIKDPNIDIITSHYYGSDFAKRFRSDYAGVRGKKAFIVGEFGLVPDNEIETLVNAIVESKASGGLIWSLRQHDQYGGFRWHNEGNTKYYAYHYPGFPQGSSYGEEFVTGLIKKAAYEINGMNMPDILPPDAAPLLLPIESISDIRWRGVTGASGYDIERTDNLKGKWVVIGKNISDSVFDVDFMRQMNVTDPYDGSKKTINVRVMFTDQTAVEGRTYYYRVKAVNDAGSSDYSNIKKADNVKDEYGIITDEFDDMSLLYSRSKQIVFDKDFPGLYDLDQSRIKSAVDEKEYIVYKTSGYINSFRITGYSENKKSYLGIYGSDNGKDYKSVDTESFRIKLEKRKNYKYIFQGEIKTGKIKYLKMEFTPTPDAKATELELGSVKIAYGDMKVSMVEIPKTYSFEGPYTVDDFETYKGDNALMVKEYMRSENGGNLTITLNAC